jgi:hypothetical protein
MERLQLTRRQILKAAGAAGGLAAASGLLGPTSIFAADEPEDDALGPFGPWSTPKPIAELASAFNDFHPAISRDGRSLYFTTTRDAGAPRPFPNEIVVVQRDNRHADWDLSTLRPVDNINLAGKSTSVPNLTPEGHRMYLQSNRLGYSQLFVSNRRDTHDDDAWEPPTVVPGELNTTAVPPAPGWSAAAATYLRDPVTGLVRMYWSRFPGQGHFGNPNEDWDIYVSLRDDFGNFGPGARVSALEPIPLPADPPGTWSRDTRTAIRRDGLEIFITTNRHGGLSYSGGPIENLWVSTRSDTSTEAWTKPQLVPHVNSGFGEGGPALSWDGTTLYFFSARNASGTPGNQQLWTSVRSKVGAGA